jgi:hypothetical protein
MLLRATRAVLPCAIGGWAGAHLIGARRRRPDQQRHRQGGRQQDIAYAWF